MLNFVRERINDFLKKLPLTRQWGFFTPFYDRADIIWTLCSPITMPFYSFLITAGTAILSAGLLLLSAVALTLSTVLSPVLWSINNIFFDKTMTFEAIVKYAAFIALMSAGLGLLLGLLSVVGTLFTAVVPFQETFAIASRAIKTFFEPKEEQFPAFTMSPQEGDQAPILQCN